MMSCSAAFGRVETRKLMADEPPRTLPARTEEKGQRDEERESRSERGRTARPVHRATVGVALRGGREAPVVRRPERCTCGRVRCTKRVSGCDEDPKGSERETHRRNPGCRVEGRPGRCRPPRGRAPCCSSCRHRGALRQRDRLQGGGRGQSGREREEENASGESERAHPFLHRRRCSRRAWRGRPGRQTRLRRGRGRGRGWRERRGRRGRAGGGAC